MFYEDGLSKKIELEYDLSLLSGKMAFNFHEKMMLFQMKNERRSFSKKYMEI